MGEAGAGRPSAGRRGPAPALRIRAGTAADLEAVAEVAAAAFEPLVQATRRRPAPLDADVGAALARGALVVADDGTVAGYAIVHAAEGRLDAVAVRPDRQGAGIGRALIAAAEDRARQAGAPALRLFTAAALAASVRLYPQLGYRETGRGEVDGLARVYFEKPLPPAVARRPAVEQLYGRRRVHGHGLPAEYAAFALDLGGPADLAALFPGARVVRLEVGFGAGEHLIAHARGAPDVGLIGAEPFESGVRHAVAALRAEGLAHVRLYNGDARQVLEWLPAGSLDRVDVLYPDPWHKQKHWKRRFISAGGLDRLARVLRPGGTVRFASDIPAYVEWTRAHVRAHGAFVLGEDSAAPWEGWPGTRYEAKAFREGRTPRYLTLLREGGEPGLRP